LCTPESFARSRDRSRTGAVTLEAVGQFCGFSTRAISSTFRQVARHAHPLSQPGRRLRGRKAEPEKIFFKKKRMVGVNTLSIQFYRHGWGLSAPQVFLTFGASPPADLIARFASLREEFSARHRPTTNKPSSGTRPFAINSLGAFVAVQISR